MEETMEILKQEYEKINNYLKHGTDINALNLKRDSTLFSKKVTFENGYYAVLEVFTGEENVMATVYLYDSKGNDITYIESDSGIDDYYSFEEYSSEYRLNIKIIE